MSNQDLVEKIIGINTAQKEFVINGVRIGGLPGTNPVLLIGSMFYMGDKLVENPEEGIVRREETKTIIEKTHALSQEYKVGFALDVIMYTDKAARNILPFIADIFDGLIFLDGVDENARIEAVKIADEIGIIDRSILNALYVSTTDKEIEALKEHHVKNAVLMVFDPSNPLETLMPENKLRLAKEKLLVIASKAGIENTLLDTVVLDPSSIIHNATSIRILKNALGLPSGCAPANISSVLSKKILGEVEAISISTSIVVLLRLFGADFIFYGPVKKLNQVVSGVAFADALLGYLYRGLGLKIPKEHPLNSILRKVQRVFASQR